MPTDEWKSRIRETIAQRYEWHNFNHAVEILDTAYPALWQELQTALDQFILLTDDIMASGGNESTVPKKLSVFLRPNDWKEMRIIGDLLVKLHQRNPNETKEFHIHDFIDSHNIDYVKDRVAVDLEWNSKDQTFDRDLYAFRTFYECNIISCGVIITRSEEMNRVFRQMGVMAKYGASTTWMGKLLPRIQSGRHGGCPLLVVGITPRTMETQEGASYVNT
ncbi:MAG: restriction endonuclease [Oscillospiraceae bacterium]|jgi:hypothetical protein|nr:restriction endonuclease [Oscillospiraceae bacterium]